MATVKVFNDMFEDKSEDFIYDTTRPLLEQIEEHIDKDIYKTTMVECYDPQTGETFYAPMEDDNETEGVLIVVNGQSVDKDFIPQEHDVVNVVFTPLGSQNIANGVTIGALAGATLGILTAAALFLAFPLAIGAGTAIGLALIGAGVGALAGFAYGYDQDRKAKSGKRKNIDGKDSNQLPDVRGCSNQSLVGNNFPYVVGKHLITPFIVGDPYTYYTGTKGKDAYLTVLLCAGYAPLKLTDFKLGDFMLAYNRSHSVAVKEYSTMPENPTEGMVVKYTGSTTETYINGKYYKYDSGAWSITSKYQSVDGGTEVIQDTVIAGAMEGYSTEGVPDTGEIVDFWSKNDVRMEIIQQTNADDVLGYGATEYLRQAVSGNTYGFGTLYPEVVKEQTVDANIFYIADKALDDNVPVSYKGVSFPNKYRTNTVIFTESCPRQFTINLDFPSGLYKTRTETSDNVSRVVYSQIPLWLCVQWRVYNKNNASSDALGNDYDSWNTVSFGSTHNMTFSATAQAQDKAAHSGNDFGTGTLEDIYQGFRGKELQNFYVESGEDGIDEMRFSATVTLTKEQCKQVIADTNPTKCIEVRVLRVSPNYINEIEDTGNGMWSFSDHVKVTTVVTRTFDYQELRDNDQLIPTRVASESDLRKLCFIAVRCKADASGFIQNNFDQINCVAESFSPIWDITEKKILPEGITKQTKYYGYFVGDSDVRTNRTDTATEREVTKADYEQARHDGFNWYAEKCGSNFTYLMKDIVMSNQWPSHGMKNWKLPATAEKYNDNLSSSGFLLSLFGAQSGPEAVGMEDLNITSIADWAETIDGLEDGSTFPVAMDYKGTHYNAGDLVPVRYEANAYLYAGTKIEDVLQKIAFTGRAVWVIDESGKVKVVFDGPVPYTKGAIASENCISSSNAYTYEEPPAGLFITYSDEDDGYENNSFHVWSDGNTMKNHHGTVEQFGAEFVTNNIQMHSLARYSLANRILNKEILTRKIGPGGVIYSLGDVVLIQGEDLLIGDVSGRIQEVIEDNDKIYGFITDAVYEYTGETSSETTSVQGVTVIQNKYTGKSNAVTIPLSAPVTKEINGKTYTLQPGQTNLVLFAPTGNVWGKPKGNNDPSPTSDVKYSMKTGDIVMYGLIDKISAPYRIIKIKPEANGCFTETLIPYNEDLYNYGAELPTFQSYITPPATLVDPTSVSDVPTNFVEQNYSFMSIYNTIGVKRSSTPPDPPTSISATAFRDYIQLYWTNSTPEDVKYTEIEMSTQSGAEGTWNVVGRVNADNWRYNFRRTGTGADGYPEATAFGENGVYRFRLKNVSMTEVEGSPSEAQTVTNTTYGTWQPANPSFIDKIPGKDGIDFTWNTPASSVSDRQLYGTSRFELKIKYNGTERQTISTSATKAGYDFIRSRDGYPERTHTSDAPGLDLYTFDLKVSNESGKYAEITGVMFNSSTEVVNYGTWTPYIASNYILTKSAEQDGINFEWKAADGNGSELYGGVKYTVNLYYDNVLRSSINTDSLQMFYVFDRSTDGYPEVGNHVETGDTDLALYTVTITATSSMDGLSDRTTTSTATTITTSGYKTWKIPTMSIQSEVLDRTAILTAIYTGDNIYGTPQLMARIKRRGNLDEVNGQTFNAYLGITEDTIYFEPEFEESPQPSSTSNTELNYRKVYPKVTTMPDTPNEGDIVLYDGITGTYVQGTYYQYNGTDWVVYVFPFFKSNSNKITHTLPLLGQTPRLFNSSDVFIGKFSYEATDVTEEPQNPQQGDVIHYIGVTTSDFEEGKYYLYTTDWEELISKTVFVPTIYKYELQLTNESGNVSNTVEREITALCTSISDLVHSHEHYKELYVEKLSAISANVGMISQGGMGSFAEQLNYWALSDMYSEDTGVPGVIKKGAFRVGGQNEYFKVTPLGEGQYAIELKAGNISLTSTVDGGEGMTFQSGTYIYDGNDSHKRLWLTPTGMIAQKETNEGTEQNPNWKWNNVANVNIDANGNLILSNATGANQVKYGFVAEGADIYHLETNTLDEDGANPQSLTFSGGLKSIDETMNPILDTSNSTKCYEGTVTKDIQNYAGTVVAISKSKCLVHGATTNRKAININGTITDLPDSYASNNAVMQETSTVDTSKSVGEYLGLSPSQIQNGIWY